MADHEPLTPLDIARHRIATRRWRLGTVSRRFFMTPLVSPETITDHPDHS